MYSPYINRFLQPDTIIPDLSNPQSWNRYSYVMNNPINLSDPTGHCVTGLVVDTLICADILIAAVVVTAITEATIYALNNTPQGQRIRDNTTQSVLDVSKRVLDRVAEFERKVASTNSRKDIPRTGCTASLANLLVCVGLGAAAEKGVNDALKKGGCGTNSSNSSCPPAGTPTVPTTATPTATSTATPTSTPGCPPYRSCPNTLTPTTTPTQTLMPTSTNTPTNTPTSTPTMTPTASGSFWERRLQRIERDY